jgi:hypothetical protein
MNADKDLVPLNILIQYGVNLLLILIVSISKVIKYLVKNVLATKASERFSW